MLEERVEIDNYLTLPREGGQFLALNQQILAELITFLDFAEDFTLGFVEINRPPDADSLLNALKTHPQCQDIQLEILDFADCPDLRFLRDEIVRRLSEIARNGGKKLALVVRGLEKSIGVFGDYPPVLQDLNFVRDAYKISVPHPLLFILPDYAITRIAKFAPDFWAWRSGVFLFRTVPAIRENDFAVTQSLNSNDSGTLESSERIELLEQLLQDYRPSPGHPDTPADLNTCNTILHQLGVAYLSRHDLTKASAYLKQALELATQRQDSDLQAEIDSTWVKFMPDGTRQKLPSTDALD
jgi:tetratricopeptide (TPR) repeat protein